MEDELVDTKIFKGKKFYSM